MRGFDQKREERLYEVIASLDSPEEVGKVLEELFTAQEINDAGMKLEIAARLKRGVPVASILSRLPVSSKTVSRVNVGVQKSPGYKLAFKRWEEWALREQR